jgi:phenylpropionate dioxygenase-like ring-hydroxylating dioxygenase large terminal subunit
MEFAILLATCWRVSETEAFVPATPFGQAAHQARIFHHRRVITAAASSSLQREQARRMSGAEPESQLDIWANTWYPLAFEDLTDQQQPQRCNLLGTQVVFWKGEGEWFAAVDECPHRLAPLSEGRVVNGCIECPYHGWQFEGAGGGCVAIPQLAEDASANKKQDDLTSKDSRAELMRKQAQLCSIPVAVRQGILFAYAAPLFEPWSDDDFSKV